MDASRRLSEYFDSLIVRCNRDHSGRPVHRPRHDQIIYYVISTRCEMDINGFDSVFDQLLTEGELAFLIDAFRELNSPRLAELFDQARLRLLAAGFYDEEGTMVADLNPEDVEFLDDLEQAISNEESLWELDERLIALIPPATR